MILWTYQNNVKKCKRCKIVLKIVKRSFSINMIIMQLWHDDNSGTTLESTKVKLDKVPGPTVPTEVFCGFPQFKSKCWNSPKKSAAAAHLNHNSDNFPNSKLIIFPETTDGTEDQATAADSLNQTKTPNSKDGVSHYSAQTKTQGLMDASLGTRVLLKD